MKTIKDKKREFLYNNGYWEAADKVSSQFYKTVLQEDERKKYTERDTQGNYIIPKHCPDISDEEFSEMVDIAIYEKSSKILDKMSSMLSGINTLKACMIFFVVLQVLSIIGSIIVISKIGSLF